VPGGFFVEATRLVTADGDVLGGALLLGAVPLVDVIDEVERGGELTLRDPPRKTDEGSFLHGLARFLESMLDAVDLLRRDLRGSAIKIHSELEQEFKIEGDIEKQKLLTFMLVKVIPHQGGQLLQGIGFTDTKNRNPTVREIASRHQQYDHVQRRSIKSAIGHVAREYVTLDQIGSTFGHSGHAETFVFGIIGTRILAMHLDAGTTVDVFGETWMEYCDGCLATAIQLKFDLLAHELDPRLHLDKAPGGPGFDRLIQGMAIMDERSGTHVVDGLFEALAARINALAEATQIGGQGYSARHGGKTIVEVYHEEYEDLKAALIAGNLYGLPKKPGIYQLLAAQW